MEQLGTSWNNSYTGWNGWEHHGQSSGWGPVVSGPFECPVVTVVSVQSLVQWSVVQWSSGPVVSCPVVSGHFVFLASGQVVCRSCVVCGLFEFPEASAVVRPVVSGPFECVSTSGQSSGQSSCWCSGQSSGRTSGPVVSPVDSCLVVQWSVANLSVQWWVQPFECPVLSGPFA